MLVKHIELKRLFTKTGVQNDIHIRLCRLIVKIWVLPVEQEQPTLPVHPHCYGVRVNQSLASMYLFPDHFMSILF